MKSLKKILFTLTILLFMSSPVFAGDIYRVCNDSTSEHLYTPSSEEKDALVSAGWAYEGTGWVAPEEGAGIYRVCSPEGTHLYTASPDEVNNLVAIGWTVDFNGEPTFYSDGEIPVYRMYNPQNGNHQWTTTQSEIDSLSAIGWTNEGVAFNAQQEGVIIERPIPTAEDIENSKRDQIVNQAATYLGSDGTQFQNRRGIPGLAWCAAFVTCVFQDCGLDYAIPVSNLANDFLAWGISTGNFHSVTTGYIPKAGDIIVYDYNHNGSGDHVGIVCNATGPLAFNSIEGNTGSPRLVRNVSWPTGVTGYVSPAF